MNIGKICDYLYDIGILDINSIEDFLLLHENISLKNANKNDNNLALTLTTYLTQKFNSKQSLNNLSENIINSYSNHIVIKRYNGLKVLYNILVSKLRSRYTLFFSKINFFIFKKFNNKNNNNKKDKNIIEEGKIIKKNKDKNDKNINENKEISDKENNINDKNNKNVIKENERKLNYDYNLYELSNNPKENINNKSNEEENIENNHDINNKKIEDNFSSEINEENKNKIINNEENTQNDKENYRYYYKINNEEFYEEEKKYLKKLEESKTKLEIEKQKEYLLRCPFFPLVNSYSRKLSKKRTVNDKKRISTAFSCDKNISKKEVFKKIIKEFSPKKKNKADVDYNNLEKKKLKEMEEKIKEEKMKKEKEKEEQLKNIENNRPKCFSKETMIRLAQPTTIKKIEEEYKNKNHIINDNNQKLIKKKNKKDIKDVSPKKKEKVKKTSKPKKKKEKKEENKKVEDKKKEDKKEEEKKEEEKKEEEKKEEEKNDEEKKENLRSVDNNIRESNVSSSSLDMEGLINQCNNNVLGQIHQMGGFQSHAINNLINQIV